LWVLLADDVVDGAGAVPPAPTFDAPAGDEEVF
jgi:hypothetical protein